MKRYNSFFLFLFLCAFVPFTSAQQAQQLLGTTLSTSDIDYNAFVQRYANKEVRVSGREPKEQMPEWVLWTSGSTPGHTGITYGQAPVSGTRYLRIGFKKTLAVGSVLVKGGGRLSVLKEGAPYPGDLSNEEQWIEAKRAYAGKYVTTEVGKDEYALWILPPNTSTRALRFSHSPDPADGDYGCVLQGVQVSPERLNNVAAAAQVTTSANAGRASVLVNGQAETNAAVWANYDRNKRDRVPGSVVSESNPVVVTLTFKNEIEVSGLCLFDAGFQAAEVQFLDGSGGGNTMPVWKKAGNFTSVLPSYGNFYPNYISFAKPFKTKSVRLYINNPVYDSRFQLAAFNGTRVWLGDIAVLQNIGSMKLYDKDTNSSPGSSQHVYKGIPFKFYLPTAGNVTLVVEDQYGKRVRNLVEDAYFPAGNNTVFWNGITDLKRDADAAAHGLYHIPEEFAAEGKYRVKGVVHNPVSATYQFSVLSSGTPPWMTDDHTGGWLADHSAPQSVLFVPAVNSPNGKDAMLIGCYVAESSDGLIWVDMQGKKIAGKKWLSGVWTAAPYLSADVSSSVSGGSIYACAVWSASEASKAEIRITAIEKFKDESVITLPIGDFFDSKHKEWEVRGFAVYDNIAVVSLSKRDKLLLIDLKAKKKVGEIPLPDPKGVVFTKQGALLALSGNNLVRFSSVRVTSYTTLTSSLPQPSSIMLSPGGDEIYIAAAANSHQVLVLTPSGKLKRTVGVAGAPVAGVYNKLHMNNPNGMALDSFGRLWVAETDYLPKRMSVWDSKGQLVRAFYGPGKYGGGGTIDAADKAKLYYADVNGTLEYKIDWQRQQATLVNVLYREKPGMMPLGERNLTPETAFYRNGKRYFTNSFNTNPGGGHQVGFIFLNKGNVIVPVAAAGKVKDWPYLKELAPVSNQEYLFLWSDGNENAVAELSEVQLITEQGGGVTVMPDLSINMVVKGAVERFKPLGFSSVGVPYYSTQRYDVLTSGASEYGGAFVNQVLSFPDGGIVATGGGIAPFDKYSLCGDFNNQVWAYPNMWPGIHPSHNAPVPEKKSILVGTTRLLGPYFYPSRSSEPLWALNSNHGMVYVFTEDGLLVTTLFEPMRSGKPFKMPLETKGLNLKNVTLGEENFWPTITGTATGEVYIVSGISGSIIKIEGLDSMRRVTGNYLSVTQADLQQCAALLTTTVTDAYDAKIFKVPFKNDIVTDGDLKDWGNARWMSLEARGTDAYFNATNRAYNIEASVAVTASFLMAAFKTEDKNLIRNSGSALPGLFKTGGGLDIMIGAVNAPYDRTKPAMGDMRLLIAEVSGRIKALLYKPVSPDSHGPKVPFSSPWRTIKFDEVIDVSQYINVKASGTGNFEIAVPLNLLRLTSVKGKSIRADIGVLRGDGTQTIARSYWSNKNTAIVSDVPSEAELLPQFWGEWEF